METATSFDVLKVTASITPQREAWVKTGDYAKLKIGDDGKVHMGTEDAHWDILRTCVDDARAATLRCLGAISAVGEDKKLSASGKADARKQIGEKALASMEKSGHLTRARDAVERQVAAWNKQLAPKPPEDIAGTMLAREVRSHLAAMSKSAERVSFIVAHLGDPAVASAVTSAPAFLSGLSDAEMAVVQQQMEKITNPEIAQARDEAMRALSDAERGYRAAANQIRQAAGIEKPLDGTA